MLSRNLQRLLTSLAAAWILGGTVSGCKSAFVEAVLRNDTAQPVTLIEVDYPSASFGRAILAPDAEFHYKFKILGTGGTRIQWTDVHHQEHTIAGPVLHEGEQGKLSITIGEAAVHWDAQLH